MGGGYDGARKRDVYSEPSRISERPEEPLLWPDQTDGSIMRQYHIDVVLGDTSEHIVDDGVRAENIFVRQTGYSVYNQDAKGRTRTNSLPKLYPDLPNKRFDIIYADPPWDYNGKLQFDKTSKSADKVDLSKKIFISSAAFKYPTLKTPELMKIPVDGIAKNDCLLFMWTSNPHLAQAIELGKAWGFEYRTVAFVWDKMSHNPGKYTLSNCELCLVFKRGRIPRPRGARDVQQLVRSPRGEHSEKPAEVRQAIEKMFPTQERIELFARKRTDGWSAWGIDVLEVAGAIGSHQQTL